MAKAIASLSVSLTARTKAFQKGMKNARKSLKAFSVSVASASKRLAKFTVGTTAVASAAIALFTKRALDQVDQLAKVSQKLGVNIAQLQTYQFVAKRAGVEVRTFNLSIQRMLRRVAEAAVGTGEAQQALKDLGIDAKRFSKLDLDQKIRKLAEAFEQIKDPGQQLRLAFKLFDSEGVAMVNVLKRGSKELDRAVTRFKRLGGAVTAVNAKIVEQARDALGEVAFSFTRIFQNFAIAVSPIITTVSRWLANMVADLNPADMTFRAFFLNIASGAGQAVDAMKRMRIEVKLLGISVKSELIRAIDFFRNNQSLIQGLAFGFTGKLIPGNRAAGTFVTALKEDIAGAFKEITKLKNALDANPTSLRFMRSLQKVFEEAERLAGGQVDKLGTLFDSMASLSGGGGGGGGRSNQFRQVSVSRFGTVGSSSKAVHVRSPVMEKFLERIANAVSSGGIPQSGGLLP